MQNRRKLVKENDSMKLCTVQRPVSKQLGKIEHIRTL